MRRLAASTACVLLAATLLATTADTGPAHAAPRADLGADRRVDSDPRAAATPLTIGSTAGDLALNCGSGATVTESKSGPGEPSYIVPSDGVITSFSNLSSTGTGQVRLVMFGAANGTSYPVEAKTAPQTLAPSALNTFSVRVPVSAGWLLGGSFTGNSPACGSSGVPSDVFAAVSAGNIDVDPVVTLSPAFQARADISAVLEPDADRDGFGDLTQDGCPVSALAQVPCPAPETRITKKPRARSGKRRVKVAFVSSVPGSTFLVSLDGRKAVRSLSPFVRKLGYGRHIISVQAVSPLSPVDETPATAIFKIKKKMKKKTG